ncbi:phosphatase PAP2 family protein [Candidatus Microgenomates bacterium]|nr:phosphatase PAP2 family protein [Candidatus Microgenomates bacterium]
MIWEKINTKVFLTINSWPHPDWAVFLMRFFSLIGYGGIFWLVLALLIILLDQKKIRRVKAFFLIVIALVATLIINEIFIKNIFAIIRPQYVLLEPGLRFWEKGFSDYSFVSGHAFSYFACAFFLTKLYSGQSWWLYILATITAFSRVYLGSHWPFDILAGAALGLLTGVVIWRLWHIPLSKNK